MKVIETPAVGSTGTSRVCILVAASLLLAATLIACGGGGPDSGSEERMLELEAKAHSLEESLEALAYENTELEGQVAVLRQEQVDFVEAQKAAEGTREPEVEASDFEEEMEEQLAKLVEGETLNDERLSDLNTRVGDLESAASGIEGFLPLLKTWFEKMEERLALLEGPVLERTVRMAEAFDGEVYNIDDLPPGVEDRSILIMPLEIIEGETPLIISLHGYGGNSADHSLYIPLHQHLNEAGFGLLLANGTMDAQGNRFWNPTDQFLNSGKTGADDVVYLAELVSRAKKLKNFGPVYLFGHSNGGFMSYHMACKGLPGLRAVASLAGTSYVEDSSCDGVPSVSVLHIHGTDDQVVLFEGDESEPDQKGEGEPAFYAGAVDMVMRWSERAGCNGPKICGLTHPWTWMPSCRAPKRRLTAWNQAAPKASI